MQIVEDYFKKKYVGIILGVLFIFLLSFSYFWIYGSRLFVSKAGSQGFFSPENSYYFATPLTAAANGDDVIRLYVFLLSDRGLGVRGSRIELIGAETANIHQIEPITDASGKAVFDISSVNKGVLNLKFSTKGIILPQTLQVTFY